MRRRLDVEQGEMVHTLVGPPPIDWQSRRRRLRRFGGFGPNNPML